MPVVPFQKTGTAPEDTPWSWNADSQNAILGTGDDQDWALYKQAHAWWDGATGSDAEAKSHYKLPHHRKGDSGLEAVWHGVANAMARLPQTDLPDAEMRGAYDHLAKHYAQWDKEPPDFERDIMPQVRMFRMRRERARAIRDASASPLPQGQTTGRINLSAARPGGTPTDDDMARINSFARSPLEPTEVYAFPTQVSSQVVDAYYTRMSPATLERFAQDANSGIAVCDSHEHYRLPIGRSFYGETAESATPGGYGLSTQTLGYMVRGLATSSGLNTNDYIRGIEAGVYNDVSVGFIPDHYWCSVCGADMLRDWECSHMPGMTYSIKRPGEQAEHEELCVAEVDARLAEYSLVYDGATPGAMLLKAERMLEAGQATPRILAFVEDTCRVNLRHRWQGFGAGVGGTTAGRTPAGLVVPSGVAASPARVGDTVATSVATLSAPSEGEEMKGTDFIRGVMVRAGKEMSAANLARLQQMHDDLSAGHDTMDEALKCMADFLAEKRGDDDGDEAGRSTPEGEARNAGSSSPKSEAGAKGKSTHKSRKDSEDGDGDEDDYSADDAEENDGDEGEESADEAEAEDAEDNGDPSDEDGDEGKPGKSEPDDKKGSSAKKRGKGGTSDPGTDDGDGDDDEPDKNPEAEEQGDKPTGTGSGEEDDQNEGGKSKAKKSAKRAPEVVPPALSAEQRAAIEYYQRQRARVVDEARAAAVRALGDSFTEDTYAPFFQHAGVEQLEQFRDNMRQLAAQVLSPRGRFVPQADYPGGGYWTDEPAMSGGRQTQARHPSDPVGVVPAGAKPTSGASVAPRGQVGGASGNPDLYRVGRTARKSRV